ncbi:hypothetical protein Tco_0483643 [Tanacetum coccineum]
MLSNQKPSGDKLGLGFNSFEASSSGTKEIKFVKAQKKASFDGGPINMGSLLTMQAAPKAIMRPSPVATPGFEKIEDEEKAKHSDLKSKTFEEIQALYEKVKRFDESFTVVGSIEDERKIKEMNEGAKDLEQKRIKKKVAEETSKTEDTVKVPAKVDMTEQGTIDSEIMEKKSFISKLDKVSSPEGDYLVIHRANGNFRAFNYLLEVLHIFDRQDLFHLYNLMMEQYSEITLEGFELILWGDLKIMMESSTEETNQSDFWSNQQDWKIYTWRLYEACGVYILELEDRTVIHMLVKRRDPLSKDLLQRMLDLGL